MSFILGVLDSKAMDVAYAFINPQKGEALAEVPELLNRLDEQMHLLDNKAVEELRYLSQRKAAYTLNQINRPCIRSRIANFRGLQRERWPRWIEYDEA